VFKGSTLTLGHMADACIYIGRGAADVSGETREVVHRVDAFVKVDMQLDSRSGVRTRCDKQGDAKNQEPRTG
jgi:hypothetical protein